MQKKLLCGLAPLLAVAAFMVVPALAQAQAQWYVCQKVTAKTGKFTKINCATEKAESNFEKELVGNLSNAVLAVSRFVPGGGGEEGELDISCDKLEGESLLWNRGGIGRDIDEFVFSENCKAGGEWAGCTVVEPIYWEADTILEIENGKIYNKYSQAGGEPLMNITLANCPEEKDNGTWGVTGTTRAEVVDGGKVQNFNLGEKTLKFKGKALAFVGEIEQEGLGGEGVFVK